MVQHRRHSNRTTSTVNMQLKLTNKTRLFGGMSSPSPPHHHYHDQGRNPNLTSPSLNSTKYDTTQDEDRKSWDLALQPFKQIPMNLFIMYMAGGSISAVALIMIGMLLVRHISALMSFKSTFATIEMAHMRSQKAIYFTGNLLCLAMVVYKYQAMGLLPAGILADWLGYTLPGDTQQHSGGTNLVASNR